MALKARTIATGVGQCEGPVIRPDGEVVVVSMDQGCLYRIKDGKQSVLARTGWAPNGATEWSDGTIYVAQNSGRTRGHMDGTGGIQVVKTDGSVTYLTKDPVSPNDLCFGPDGKLYVTDPTRRPERNDGRLWRIDIETGAAELLCSVPWYPNGIGFGLETDVLYVASFAEQRIVRYAMSGGKLGVPETYVQLKDGRPDGFCFDAAGNIIIGAIDIGGPETADTPGQIQTYDRTGKLVDVFEPPSNRPTNVALGADRTLVICDTSGGQVFAVDGWPNAGLPLYPYRKN